MKNLSTLIFILISCSPSFNKLSAQCPDGNILLERQGQVDSFNIIYPNCQNVINDLRIRGYISSASNITDLVALSNITQVGGDLKIFNNPDLTSLVGLDNIIHVENALSIYNNASLDSLGGLGGVTQIGGNLGIGSMPNLTNLSGFENLTQIGGNLGIGSMPNLTNLSGLEHLTQIGAGVVLTNNANLINLEGLENINQISNGLNIRDNPRLKDIAALSGAFDGTEGWLTVVNNDSLVNLAPIEGASFREIEISNNNNLQYLTDSSFTIEIAGGLVIENNPKLASLNGLHNIKTAFYVIIENNDALVNLNGLNNLNEIWWYGLRIIDNNALLNLHGLENLEHVSYSPEDPQSPIFTASIISENDALQSLEGLNVISSSMEVSGNPLLSNLHGLENATLGSLYVGGNINLLDLTGLNYCSSLTLGSNRLLTTLHGLEHFEGFYELRISNNEVLTSLNGIDSVKEIFFLEIYNNDALETLQGLVGIEEINSVKIWENDILKTLDGLGTAETLINNISIYSNPLLSKCHVESICNMLSTHPLEVGMLNNTFGCNTRNEVLDSCMFIIGTENIITDTDFLQINPNPAFTHFNVQFLKQNQGKIENIQVFDALGQLVYMVKGNHLSHKVDVTDWTKGLYVVLVNGRFVEKVLVE